MLKLAATHLHRAQWTLLLPLILGGLLLIGTPTAAASAPIRIGMLYEPSSLDPDKLTGPKSTRSSSICSRV